MSATHHRVQYHSGVALLLMSGLLVSTILAIGLVAPRETTMGDAQRIVYVHVAVAWFALLGFIGAAVNGLAYLLRRHLKWDHRAQACAEVGWLCASLTLVTGSLWAHSAWGTWWTWEPRLTSAFVMWCMYGGYLIARNNIEDHDRRARLTAVLAIVGALDVPLVIMATRLFRGIHPVSPQMEPSMRIVLLLSVASFTALFAWLLAFRSRQIRHAHEISLLELRVAADPI